MQIKTTMRYHLTHSKWLSSKYPQTANAGEGMERREPLVYLVGSKLVQLGFTWFTWWEVNWYSYYGEQYGGSLKN